MPFTCLAGKKKKKKRFYCVGDFRTEGWRGQSSTYRLGEEVILLNMNKKGLGDAQTTWQETC